MQKHDLYFYFHSLLSCGFVCELPHQISTEEIDSIIHAHSYDVHLKSSTASERLVYRNTISALLDHREKPMKEHSTSRILTNDPYFNSTTSRIGENKMFFPTPQLYELSCSYIGKNATCVFDKSDFVDDSIEEVKESTFRIRVSHDAAQKNSVEVRSYWVNAISVNNTTEANDDYDGVDSITCIDNLAQVFLIVTYLIIDL